MARGSNSTGRFTVWDQGGDPYAHVTLAANWDKVDAVIGGPPGGGWPASGQSIYTILTAQQQIPLGATLLWTKWANNLPIPAGFVALDGSTVLAANHDLVDANGIHLGDIQLPDTRGVFPMGADATLNIGVSSSAGNSTTNAPGPQGGGGSNAALVTSLTVPDHHHLHQHIHEVGNLTDGSYETADASGNHTYNGQGGGTNSASLSSHTHHMDIYTSNPRWPDNANQKVSSSDNSSDIHHPRYQTTKAFLSDPTSDATAPTGGNPDDALTMTVSQDVRPLHIGFVFIQKIKNS